MSRKLITIEKKILKKNEIAAEENRQLFAGHNVFTINLLSSPGAGKTSLLVKAAASLHSRLNVAVTVGDLQTEEDSKRIEEAAVPVVQINTGTACHLDANMVQKSLSALPIESTDVLFVENVGNLVCPASFDLGEHLKVVLLSTTEGEEKPLKYPPIFHAADCVCINKIDLLPYIDFNLEKCRENLNRICPRAEIFEFSCKTGEGIDRWLDWIVDRRNVVYPNVT